jgi:hypothetical protein
MTYNFDPERWYANEREVLEREHRAGRLDWTAYEAGLERLQQKLDDLWDRLDGSYRLPGRNAD